MNSRLANITAVRKVIDMAGRSVVVPKVIRTVYAPSQYGFNILYSLAPEKLAGVLYPLSDELKRFLQPCVHDLPVIGMINNTEELKKAAPDVVVVWADKKNPYHKKSEEALTRLGIPFVYVTVGDLGDLCDYPAAYEFLGQLLGKEDLAAQMSAYCRKTLTEAEAVIQKIPAGRRPGVYYAEEDDGLSTEYEDSLHVHLLKLVGDVNVRRGSTTSHAGLEKVTFEKLAEYDPDVILAFEKPFYQNVFNDAAWSKIKAVRNRAVYLIPGLPFNWFDRPPSFMRIIGLKWLMSILYPHDYKIDLIAETREFYRLFLGVTISAADAQYIING